MFSLALCFVKCNIFFIIFDEVFRGKRAFASSPKKKRAFLNDCWVSHIPNPTVCLCPFSRKSSPIDKTRGFDHTHTSMHAPRVQQGITIVLETERRVYRRGNRVKGEPSCSCYTPRHYAHLQYCGVVNNTLRVWSIKSIPVCVCVAHLRTCFSLMT